MEFKSFELLCQIGVGLLGYISGVYGYKLFKKWKARRALRETGKKKIGRSTYTRI